MLMYFGDLKSAGLSFRSLGEIMLVVSPVLSAFHAPDTGEFTAPIELSFFISELILP